MEMLNVYLNIASNAVADRGGTINQFMGDALYAMFNAPDDQPDHALRAVQAGLDIQKAITAYQGQSPSHLPRLHFGVGINTGPAVVGNIGAHWRYDYTAIGDTINLASRISSAARGKEVLISPTTYEQLQGCISVTPLHPMQFKGKSQSINIYRVLALRTTPEDEQL